MVVLRGISELGNFRVVVRCQGNSGIGVHAIHPTVAADERNAGRMRRNVAENLDAVEVACVYRRRWAWSRAGREHEDERKKCSEALHKDCLASVREEMCEVA